MGAGQRLICLSGKTQRRIKDFLSLLCSAVFIFVAVDVVFVKPVAKLDFDDYEWGFARVGQSMFGSLGNFDGLVPCQIVGCFINLDLGCAADDGPVLASVFVRLQA